ncbi:MAG: cupredoxin family copper-binding protein [bacterium]|nr:cupredoxin family copper-binding protein [bacterium]
MKNLLIIAVIVVVLAAGYLLVNWNGPASNEAPAPGSTPEAQTPKSAVIPSGSVSAPKTWTVTIQNFFFSVPTLVVKKGDTVTWTNKDSAPHTVTGDNGGPASPTLKQNETYSYTFNTAGTFSYRCSFHPAMLSTVVVQ